MDEIIDRNIYEQFSCALSECVLESVSVFLVLR